MSDAREWPPAEPRQSGRLDEAIDRAVRRIVQIDPPAGLRFRVFARLERPPSSSPLFLRLAYAGAALALMAAVTLVMRDTASTPPRTAETPAVERTPLAAADRATPSTPPAIPPRLQTGERPRVARTPAPRLGVPPADRRISAASLPDDRDFAPVTPAGVVAEAPSIPGSAAALPPIPAPAPIEIAPLVIQPLRIEPLPPRK